MSFMRHSVEGSPQILLKQQGYGDFMRHSVEGSPQILLKQQGYGYFSDMYDRITGKPTFTPIRVPDAPDGYFNANQRNPFDRNELTGNGLSDVFNKAKSIMSEEASFFEKIKHLPKEQKDKLLMEHIKNKSGKVSDTLHNLSMAFKV